jgi:hypothetical protein
MQQRDKLNQFFFTQVHISQQMSIEQIRKLPLQ